MKSVYDNILVWSGWPRWRVASLFEWRELMGANLDAQLLLLLQTTIHSIQIQMYTNTNTNLHKYVQVHTNTEYR